MKSYTKYYYQYFGLDFNDFIGCIICGKKAVDLHHIKPRSKYPELINEVSNLVPLCRKCHSNSDIINNWEYLSELQKQNMKQNGKKISKYNSNKKM